jgi:putative IMPACT (imprinted ancient) family translation regulator
VIRYFGGTKLGTGPLGKAYYTSALLVLEKAKVLTESLFSRICVRIDFNFLPGLLRIMARKEMGVSDIRYKNSFEIEFLIRHEQVEIFKNKLNNLTKGTATIKIFENIYQ